MEFKDVLKRLREEKNITQDNLARELGLSQRTIALYETGKREPNYENMRKLEEFFHVTSAYLRGDTTTNDYDFYVGSLHLDNIKLQEYISDFSSKFDCYSKEVQLAIIDLFSLFITLLLNCDGHKKTLDELSLIISQLNYCQKTIGNKLDNNTFYFEIPHAISQSTFDFCKCYHNFVNKEKAVK